MSPPDAGAEVRPEEIAAAIFYLRGQKVMLDVHLAALYRVDTKALTRAVRRNLVRFPSDFMFRLSDQEFGSLRRQFGTSSWGGRRHLPYAFSEQGVRLRAMLASHEELARKLAAPQSSGRRPIGFGPWKDKPQ